MTRRLTRLPFGDRAEAGRLLGRALRDRADGEVVVIGLPRGGVVVAREVADALRAPLDVIVVRKLGAPSRPEYAVGAIAFGGVRVVDEDALRALGVTPAALAAVESVERAELERQVLRYRGDRPPLDLTGRVALIVDDGVATGATAIAAARVTRAAGATRVVVATPVAAPGWRERLGGEADVLVALAEPEPFGAVGRFYRRFVATTDDEVVRALRRP
jgi:predicted phosphoribosyltransferase